MMKKLALAVVLSTTALSAVAEESKDFYAQVNAGYAWGKDVTVKGTNNKLSTGKSFSAGLEGGAIINEHFRAGLSFDYMPSFGLGFKKYGADKDASIKSMNLMANLFLDAGNFSGFKPYAVVGLGVARNKSGNLGELEGTTKNNFAWKVGLGTRYEINENFDVDVRYQYLDLGKAEWKVNNQKAIESDLHANQFMFGVSYKF